MEKVRASRSGPEVSHIFFADDLLLFSEATVEKAGIIQSVLEDFCDVSGQKISLSKSVLFASKNTPGDIQDAIAHRLKIKKTTNIGKYLGVPILHYRTTTATYDFSVDNIKCKLGAWRVRLMSQASRSILIQSVLNAMPSYLMQTMELPRAVINNMEKHIRKVFWDELDGTTKMHYVAWGELCKAKEQGGLGFKSLRKMNLAFLIKLGWQMFSEKEKIWVEMLWAKYGSPLTFQRKGSVSRVWKGIIRCVEILRRGVQTSNFLHDDTLEELDTFWTKENVSKNIVRKACKLQCIQDGTTEDHEWRRIWEMKGPLRLNMLMWRMRRGFLPTISFLHRRHVCPDDRCS